MKTAKYLQVFTGLVIAMGLGTAQAKKAGFAEFAGTFKGKPNAIIYSNLPMTATADITVKVPKSGKTATVTVNGTATYLGSVYPLSNTLFFTKKTVTLSDCLFNLLANPGPASGAVTLNKRGTAATFNAVYPPSPSYVMNGTLKVRPQGKKKKKITLTFHVDSGNIYDFVFTGVAKVKPAE